MVLDDRLEQSNEDIWGESSRMIVEYRCTSGSFIAFWEDKQQRFKLENGISPHEGTIILEPNCIAYFLPD